MTGIYSSSKFVTLTTQNKKKWCGMNILQPVCILLFIICGIHSIKTYSERVYIGSQSEPCLCKKSPGWVHLNLAGTTSAKLPTANMPQGDLWNNIFAKQYPQGSLLLALSNASRVFYKVYIEVEITIKSFWGVVIDLKS